MFTEKKNQHYIPKFYLRNFSYQSNKKQIGVFNLDNQIYVPNAKLKTQGSKNFFYGSDGVIENSLADIEGELAQIIKNLIDTKKLPKRESKEHIDLLYFVLLTDFRNPVKIQNAKDIFEETNKRLLELDPNTDLERLNPKMTHDEIVRLSLHNAAEISDKIIDLDYKIIFNATKVPFLTSDFPIVKYNQFLESKNWQYSKTGYLTVGLQIFVPLSSEMILFFFDSGIYKIGERKQSCFLINRTQDIDEINKLQFINCFENIYFNEKASEFYVKQIYQQSKKYKKANAAKSELSYIFEDVDDRQKILDSGKKIF